MFKANKIWLAILLVFALVASSFQTSALAAGKQGTISVVGPDQNTSFKETIVQYGDNETALDALTYAVGKDNVGLGNGNFVNSIYGLAGTPDYKYMWLYFVNGISAQVGADSYIVQDGDKISFQYADTSLTQKEVTSLSIVGKDGDDLLKFDYPIGFIGQPTALQLLKVVAGPQKLNYTSFTVNGAPSAVTADKYQLQDGDKISFQFDSWTDTSQTVTPTISDTALQTAIDKAANYYNGKEIHEWETIALKQAGKTIPDGYLENVKQIVKDKQGTFRSITDTERYSLGILAAGGDPTNIEGYNLIEAIYNGDVTKQGLNGVAYALIALDSANFKVPDTALWTRDKLVAQLLEKQNQDGGWNWDPTSTTSDVDTTAMVITVDAGY